MTAISITPGYPTFADTDGSSLNDGYVFIGLENQNPITAPTTAFWDKEFRIAADQPLRTSGGYIVRNGTPAAVYARAAYSILVQNKNLVTVYNAPSAVITNVTNEVEEITQYQGAHSTDPIARNDGTPLQTGDLYFNTVINQLKAWTGTVWVQQATELIVENFNGTGSQTLFNLATAPVVANNTQIYIDGVYQQKDTYTVSGVVISFSSAPPYLSTIEVVTVSIAPLIVDASTLALKTFVSGGTPVLEFYADTGTDKSATIFASQSATSGGTVGIKTKRDGDTPLERFSINHLGLAVFQNTASQGILVGKTVIDTTTAGIQIGDSGSGSNTRINMVGASSSADVKLAFYNSNGQVGDIQTSGTGTSYNVSSDYRLKTNAVLLDGSVALASVMSWPISSFDWIKSGKSDVGVIAHHLQAVKSSAVCGEKDAMRNGEIDPQGVDYSKLVPELVAAVQYLANRVKQLES
tara:strand:+ start:3488 stop:4885 length:1398 start_codon:yes stop_codon:yes gene_type:complete